VTLLFLHANILLGIVVVVVVFKSQVKTSGSLEVA